jgi:hypothetical protein
MPRRSQAKAGANRPFHALQNKGLVLQFNFGQREHYLFNAVTEVHYE